MNEKISVAMATYNGAKYLQEQLDSLVKQTRQPDELIICDDGSTDETIAIAQKFLEHTPFNVKVFSNDRNLGYSQNFSRALELCSGDIVFLSDQDDVWHPTKIASMLARFDEEPDAQLLIHDLMYCSANLTPIGQTKIERMSDSFDLQKDYVVGMATAVRSPFLKLCLPVPDIEDVAHDTWLHQCAVAISKKRIMTEVFAQYRRHDSNATATSNLNVNYVTGPDHFKYKTTSTFESIKMKTPIIAPDVSLLVKWLRSNRGELLDKNYCTESLIDALINDELLRVDSTKEREKILAMKRNQRFWSVFRLYRKNGYQCFSGWKSALKDILFN